MLYILVYMIIAVLCMLCLTTNKSILYFYVLISILFISIFIAGRPVIGDAAQYRNDTYNYYNYYSCLDFNDSDLCSKDIGSVKIEFLFDEVAKFFVALGLDVKFFFFFLSFIFSMSCLYFFNKLDRFVVLALLLVLSQNVYWEMTSNILRQSMAASFFIFLLTCLYNEKINYNKVFVFSLLGCFIHVIFAFYFFSFVMMKLLSEKKLLFVCLFCAVFGVYVFPVLAQFLSPVEFLNQIGVMRKFEDYSLQGSANQSIVEVLGLLNIIFTPYFVFVSSQLKTKEYSVVLCALLSLMSIALVFSGFNISYRIINIASILQIFLVLYPLNFNFNFNFNFNVNYARFFVGIYFLYSMYLSINNIDFMMRYFG